MDREEKVQKFLAFFEGKEFKSKEMVLSQSEKVFDLDRFIKYHVAVIRKHHKSRFSKSVIKDLFNIKKQLEKCS